MVSRQRRRQATIGTVGAAVAVGTALVFGANAHAEPSTPSATPSTANQKISIPKFDPARLEKGIGVGKKISVSPGGSIQAAVNQAMPGDIIQLAPGEYNGPVITARNGNEGAPITLRGAGAVIKGTDHVIQVKHSHWRFQDFTVNGVPNVPIAQFPNSAAETNEFITKHKNDIKDGRLIYIGEDTASGLTDIAISGTQLYGAGGECVRVRNNANNIFFYNNYVQSCGLFAKDTNNGKKYARHNGEAFYVGTSPKSTNQPWAGRDTTNNVWVVENTFRAFGSECVNTKEQSHDVYILANYCGATTEGYEFTGSSMELRGDKAFAMFNLIDGSPSIGIKVQSDDNKGKDNVLYGNLIRNVAVEPIRDKGVGTVDEGNIKEGGASAGLELAR